MNAVTIESNPFALLLAPELVLARIAASERLARLNSRICRPLDKPMFGAAGGAADGEATDEAVGPEAGETNEA